jgi:hypothetical protein
MCPTANRTPIRILLVPSDVMSTQRTVHAIISNPVLHYLTQLYSVGLVVEDAPSGLNAGRAAGSKTLAVCTSHTRAEIVASGTSPDFIVKDLTR